MKNTSKHVEELDVSWLLKSINAPHSAELMQDAQAAATAYHTMLTWLSVCYEYSIRLQCAQLALRLYHGRPLPWPEQREQDAKMKKEAEERAAAEAKERAAAEARAAAAAKKAAEAEAAAEAQKAAEEKKAAAAKEAADARAAAEAQAAAEMKAVSQKLLAVESAARVAVAVAEGKDASEGGSQVGSGDETGAAQLPADVEPSKLSVQDGDSSDTATAINSDVVTAADSSDVVTGNSSNAVTESNNDAITANSSAGGSEPGTGTEAESKVQGSGTESQQEEPSVASTLSGDVSGAAIRDGSAAPAHAIGSASPEVSGTAVEAAAEEGEEEDKKATASIAADEASTSSVGAVSEPSAAAVGSNTAAAAQASSEPSAALSDSEASAAASSSTSADSGTHATASPAAEASAAASSAASPAAEASSAASPAAEASAAASSGVPTDAEAASAAAPSAAGSQGGSSEGAGGATGAATKSDSILTAAENDPAGEAQAITPPADFQDVTTGSGTADKPNGDEPTVAGVEVAGGSTAPAAVQEDTSEEKSDPAPAGANEQQNGPVEPLDVIDTTTQSAQNQEAASGSADSGGDAGGTGDVDTEGGGLVDEQGDQDAGPDSSVSSAAANSEANKPAAGDEQQVTSEAGEGSQVVSGGSSAGDDSSLADGNPAAADSMLAGEESSTNSSSAGAASSVATAADNSGTKPKEVAERASGNGGATAAHSSVDADENGTAAADNADNSIAAADNSTIPVDNSMTVADDSTIPAEGSTVKSDNSTSLTDNSTILAENSTAPNNSTPVAGDGTVPAENSTIGAGNSTVIAGDEHVTAVTSADIPDDNGTLVENAADSSSASEAVVTESSTAVAGSAISVTASSTTAEDSSTVAADSSVPGAEEGNTTDAQPVVDGPTAAETNSAVDAVDTAADVGESSTAAGSGNVDLETADTSSGDADNSSVATEAVGNPGTEVVSPSGPGDLDKQQDPQPGEQQGEESDKQLVEEPGEQLGEQLGEEAGEAHASPGDASAVEGVTGDTQLGQQDGETAVAKATSAGGNEDAQEGIEGHSSLQACTAEAVVEPDATTQEGQQEGAAVEGTLAGEGVSSSQQEADTQEGSHSTAVEHAQQEGRTQQEQQQGCDAEDAAEDAVQAVLVPSEDAVQGPAESHETRSMEDKKGDDDDADVPVVRVVPQMQPEQTTEGAQHAQHTPGSSTPDVKKRAPKSVGVVKQAASQKVSRSSSKASRSSGVPMKQPGGSGVGGDGKRESTSTGLAEVKARKLPSGRLNVSGNLSPHPPYGPPDTKLGKTAEQRLRRQLGDACWLMCRGAPDTASWPQQPVTWKEFRALLSQQGVRVTPGDWTDLKLHITVVKGVAHVSCMPLAQMLAPDGPLDMLQPSATNSTTAEPGSPQQQDGSTDGRGSTGSTIPATGMTVSECLSAVAAETEARLKARLSRAVHAAQQVHLATTFFHWLRFKEVMANYKVQLSATDWEDLRPFLSVTLHSTTSEQQPQPLTTYVHWQALRALMGPDGPLYKPRSSRPPSGTTPGEEVEVQPGARLTTRLAAAVFQLNNEAAADAKPLGLVDWRTFMKLMAKHGSKLTSSDPLWWDLRPYTSTDEMTTHVDLAALAAVLRPDMPPITTRPDNTPAPLPPRHAQGSPASMTCMKRLSAKLGPGTRKLYWQHHPEQQQQPLYMVWKDYNEWFLEEVGVSVSPEDWCDLYSVDVLLITLDPEQPPHLEPMTTYVDLSFLISLVGPDNPPGIPASIGARPSVRTHKGDARAATAVARLTAHLLDAVLALQDPSSTSIQPSNDACLPSPGDGDKAAVEGCSLADMNGGQVQQGDNGELASPVPDGPVPWRQMQSLLEGTGAVQPGIGPQDWADLRTLDVLVSHPAFMLVNWPRLRAILRPDGPPPPTSPPPDVDAAQTRLRELLAYPLRLLTSSMTREEKDMPYVHWVSFANLLSKAGIRLSPTAWADLADYTSITTSKTTDQQRPLPNTTYVHWSALIQDLLGDDEPHEADTSPRGTARHSAGRAKTARLRSPDKLRSSSPYAHSPKRGPAAWVPEGTRYPPLQPASAPAGLLGSMDGELHEQLVHLLSRMQGRAVCPPTMREWELALSRLDRCVDDAYRSTRQQMSYAAAGDGTPSGACSPAAGSPRGSITLPQLRASQCAYGSYAGGRAGVSPRMAWGTSPRSNWHTPREYGASGGDADSVCTEELLGKAPGAVLDPEGQYKRLMVSAVREQRARASAVMQQRMRNTLRPTTRIAGDYALPPNYAADTAAPSFPVPSGVIYQNYIEAKQENQRLLSDLKHAYKTDGSQTIMFASRASSASGVACLIPPIASTSRPVSRA